VIRVIAYSLVSAFIVLGFLMALEELLRFVSRRWPYAAMAFAGLLLGVIIGFSVGFVMGFRVGAAPMLYGPPNPLWLSIGP
jgi:uncharacterized membrane protein